MHESWQHHGPELSPCMRSNGVLPKLARSAPILELPTQTVPTNWGRGLGLGLPLVPALVVMAFVNKAWTIKHYIGPTGEEASSRNRWALCGPFRHCSRWPSVKRKVDFLLGPVFGGFTPRSKPVMPSCCSSRWRTWWRVKELFFSWLCFDRSYLIQ